MSEVNLCYSCSGARVMDASDCVPQLPNFDQPSTIPVAYLKDLFLVLRQEDQEAMSHLVSDPNNMELICSLPPNVTEYIITVCEIFNTDVMTRHVSVALFERVMCKLITGTLKWLCQQFYVVSSEQWQDAFSTVLDRLFSQMPLRVVSCVQLASKLHSAGNPVGTKAAKRFLLSIGRLYSSQRSILKSELRVLKMMGFCISIKTPLLFIETMLKILKLDMPSCNVTELYIVSLMLLDLLRYYNDRFCIELHRRCCANTMRFSERPLRLVQKDNLLVASGILVCSTLITNDNGYRLHQQVNELRTRQPLGLRCSALEVDLLC